MGVTIIILLYRTFKNAHVYAMPDHELFLVQLNDFAFTTDSIQNYTRLLSLFYTFLLDTIQVVNLGKHFAQHHVHI